MTAGGRLSLVLASLVFGAVGCSDKKKTEGLPPAQEWGADPGGPAQAGADDPHAGPHAGSPHGADPNNPHAGMNMGAMGEPSDPSNPHAGMNMGAMGEPSDPSNPHAGMNMGGGSPDVAKLNLPPPDPNRKIDPNHHIKGVIRIHPKAADRVKPGTAVFVIAKRADASGAPTGAPLAVEKLTWQKGELAFELTEAEAMIGGTELTGDVVVIARYDQDSDAISKQPGDIIGQVRVKIPADDVKLTLDQILP